MKLLPMLKIFDFKKIAQVVPLSNDEKEIRVLLVSITGSVGRPWDFLSETCLGSGFGSTGKNRDR